MIRSLILPVAVLLLTFHLSVARAVHPQTWTQTSLEDFQDGHGENVAISDRGELVLTRAHKELLSAQDDVQVVYALAEAPDGSLYAATGPKGKLLKIAPDGKVSTVFARQEDPLLLSLLMLPDGRLLIGTGGDQARILALAADGKVSVLAAPSDTNHVWALAADKGGDVYAATGPNGQLFKLAPNGQFTKVFAAEQPNLLSLAVSDDGLVYAGTDRDGLIYRFGKDNKPFVVYNADEPEIVALAFDDKGRLLAAASGGEDDSGEGRIKPMMLHKNQKMRRGTKPKMNNAPGEDANSDKTLEADETGGPSASQPLQEAEEHEAKIKPSGKGTEGAKKGPAVYLIDATGFVKEIHRFERPLQCVAGVGGEIWVGAAAEGWLDVLRPENQEEYLAYCQLPAEQVTAVLVRKSGAVAVATANSGQVFEFAPTLAKEGTFTSKAFDCEQAAAFGTVDFDVLAPDGTAVTVSTRSGNLADPDDELWSAWAAPQASGKKAGSPPARFLQSRLSLKANAQGEGPTLTEIRAIYQTPNRHPLISDFQTGAEEDHGEPENKHGGKSKPKEPPAKPKEMELSWKGTDPNEDELIYTLSFRPVGTANWILLKDRLSESKFNWDISAVPDGRYEIRIIASDAPDNAPGTELSYTYTSRPLMVANTPPTVTLEPVKIEGAEITVTAKVKSNLNHIAAVQFAVDSHENWRAASAADGIFDSPEETAVFKLSHLSSGPHYVAVRATDAAGNIGFATVEIKVP